MVAGERAWVVFLVFSAPISYKQIIVDGNGAELPVYEVKDATSLTALLVFNGDLSGRIINIHALF
jgi:hypothetical protein